MIRGTVHDLVQWIVESEGEAAQLRQKLAQLEKELAALKNPAPEAPKE